MCSRATLRELPPGEVLVARAVIAGAEVRHAPSSRRGFLVGCRVLCGFVTVPCGVVRSRGITG